MKFYITGPKDGGNGVYALLHEDGAGLASHYCSHRAFAPGDLILRRPERQKAWALRFGSLEPIETIWMGDLSQEEIDEIGRKHEEWWESEQAMLPPCSGNCSAEDTEGTRFVDGSCPRHGDRD